MLSIAEYVRYQRRSGQPVERFFIKLLIVILGSSLRFKLNAVFNYVLYLTYFIIQKKVSDMLKPTLAVRCAFIFLGVLSCVACDGDVSANNFVLESLPFAVSTFKGRCPDRLEPLFCNLRYRESPNFFRTKQTKAPTSENRTSGNETQEENSQEEISLEPHFVNPENHLYKRFIIFRRKNPIARGYKRGPGFRSWGGKRDPVLSDQNLEKKSKFVSWGGKRDGESLPSDSINSDPEFGDASDKRPKFQIWGKKKSTSDFLEEYGNENEKRTNWKNRLYLIEPFKKHVPKRPQFQSWGGKRALYPWHEFFEFLHSQPRFLLNGGEKRKFSSWGGKRYDDYEDHRGMKSFEGSLKRHVFQNWGGKRTNPDLDVPNIFDMKELESSEAAKQRDEGKAKANWEDEGNHSNLDSSGDDIKEVKDRR